MEGVIFIAHTIKHNDKKIHHLHFAKYAITIDGTEKR